MKIDKPSLQIEASKTVVIIAAVTLTILLLLVISSLASGYEYRSNRPIEDFQDYVSNEEVM